MRAPQLPRRGAALLVQIALRRAIVETETLGIADAARRLRMTNEGDMTAFFQLRPERGIGRLSRHGKRGDGNERQQYGQSMHRKRHGCILVHRPAGCES